MAGGKALHLVDDRSGGLCVVNGQGIQPLPVFRHAYGDHRDAVHRRIHPRQVMQCLIQSGAVVDAGAGYDLAVHGDVVLDKPLHDIDALPRPPVLQHLRPERPVCGVDGHVDGGDPQVDNPLHLPRGQVR